MPASATAFPILYICGSALLIACALWLAIRRSRRRIGSEPRCPSCDYLLIGLSSGRCPECGKPFDSVDLVHGHRRGRRGRVFLGLILAAAGIALSWKPVDDWYASIYWYQYRPTYLVMQDLKQGDWLRPPPGNPLEGRYIITHGWLNENVDLARVAFDELMRREKRGELTQKYRQQLDDYELAELHRPLTAPVQEYLDGDLTGRLSADKLTAAEKSTIFQNALVVTATTDPIVMQWDGVPLRIAFNSSPLNARINLEASVTFKSVRIDGREANWVSVPGWNQSSVVDVYGGLNSVENRWISNFALGDHRIDLDLQIDFCCGDPRSSPRPSIINTESQRLTVHFTETVPTGWVKFLRFLCDPTHEAFHYFSEEGLLETAANAPDCVSHLAALETMRRHRIGELSNETNHTFVDQILEIQKDPAKAWDTSYGDYIEALKVAGQLSDKQWRQYGNQQLHYILRGKKAIVEGDPLRLDLVFPLRRGDSKVDPNGLATWTIEYSIGGDVDENWDLGTLNGQTVFFVPHDDEEFTVPYIAKCPNVHPGRHTLHVKIKLIDMFGVQRPLQMEVPSEYDLREFSFDVLPRASTTGVK